MSRAAAADMLLRKLMFNISTLEDLGRVLSSSEDFRIRLKTALSSIMGSLPVAKGGFFLYHRTDDRDGFIELAAARGVDVSPGIALPLPEAVKAFVSERLPACKEAAEVREVFEEALSATHVADAADGGLKPPRLIAAAGGLSASFDRSPGIPGSTKEKSARKGLCGGFPLSLHFVYARFGCASRSSSMRAGALCQGARSGNSRAG